MAADKVEVGAGINVPTAQEIYTPMNFIDDLEINYELVERVSKYRDRLICSTMFSGALSLLYMIIVLSTGWLHFLFNLIGFCGAKFYARNTLIVYFLIQIVCIGFEVGYHLSLINKFPDKVTSNIIIMCINTTIGLYVLWLTFTVVQLIGLLSRIELHYIKNKRNPTMEFEQDEVII